MKRFCRFLVKFGKKFKPKDFFKIAFLNTFFGFIITLVPFWAKLIYVLSRGQNFYWSRFYSNGEFYLYSNALIASSFFIYFKNKVKVTDLSSLFSILTFVLVFFIALLYTTRLNSDHALIPFMKWASICTMLLALPLHFYAQIIFSKQSPDVGAQRREEQENIMEELR